MTDLGGRILRILEGLPDNQLITEEELDCKLQRCEQAGVETPKITEALHEIDESHGLVTALMETGEMLTFGVALRPKVDRFPERALIVAGLALQKEGRDSVERKQPSEHDPRGVPDAP